MGPLKLVPRNPKMFPRPPPPLTPGPPPDLDVPPPLVLGPELVGLKPVTLLDIPPFTFGLDFGTSFASNKPFGILVWGVLDLLPLGSLSPPKNFLISLPSFFLGAALSSFFSSP